jgi:hypothetical protein
MARCSATKRNGEPCTLPAKGRSGYCWAHDPSNASARKRYATRAGKGGGRGRPSTELRRLQDRFEQLSEDVLSGEINRADGAVAGQILNYARACLRDLILAREQEELAARLEQVEAALAERKRGYA